MKCKGLYDQCGIRCPECPRFQDDCDGNPDYYMTDGGDWVEEAEDCRCGECGACRDRKREQAGENQMECERNGDK
jgi:hypothetical protein